jgi:hypothetical protein
MWRRLGAELDRGAVSMQAVVGLAVGVLLFTAVMMHTLIMRHGPGEADADDNTTAAVGVLAHVPAGPAPSPVQAQAPSVPLAPGSVVYSLDKKLAVDSSRTVCRYKDAVLLPEAAPSPAADANSAVGLAVLDSRPGQCKPSSSYNREKMCNVKCLAGEGCCLDYEYCVACCTEQSFARCALACRVPFHRHGETTYCWLRTRTQPLA